MSFGTQAYGARAFGDAWAQTFINVSMSPLPAAISASTAAPTLARTANQFLTPSSATISTSTAAPIIARTQNQFMAPAGATIASTSAVPDLNRTYNQFVSLAATSIVFAGHSPSVMQATAVAQLPTTTSVRMLGRVLRVVQTQNQSTSVEASTLEFNGLPPVVSQTTDAAQPSRFAHPISDSLVNCWQPSTAGATLSSMMDEPTADSSDYIYAQDTCICRVKLGTAKPPARGIYPVMRYQCWSPSGNGLIVRLMQGKIEVASWPHQTAPGSPTVFARQLSATQFEKITDYSNLELEFQST